MEKKFYQKNWFSLFMIFFFFPLGYFMYYKYHSAKLETKGAVFLISFIIFAIALPFNMQTFITIYIPFFIYMGLIGKKQESLKKISLQDKPVENNHLNVTVQENKTIPKNQNAELSSPYIPFSVKAKAQVISTMHSETPRNAYASNLNNDPFWHKPNMDVSIKNYIVRGGMIYYGHSDTSFPDAALIDPNLPVKNNHDYVNTQMGYWPNYSNISPEARGCYLSWLADGKKDPEVNIGYVFLYFYGLERRLLLFANDDSALKNEKQLIISEIERLLSIYKENGSFHMYATSLLSYATTKELSNNIQYNKPAPKPTYHREIPLELKVGIAQMAKDQIPLPAEWALNWYLSLPEPPVYSRTVAQRCYPEFQKLFAEKYKKRFNDGILVKPNKTKLSYSYRPASGTLLGENHTTTSELSDISAIKKYINSLIPLIQECHDELDRYSRFLGRNSDKADTIDALLELPISIWPNETLEKFESILDKINNTPTPLSMSFTEFLKLIPRWENHSKGKLATFLDIAESYLGISMEPDCRLNGKVPKDDSTIVLFAANKKTTQDDLTAPSYAFAILILHLNLLVSQVDGKISHEEKFLLMNKIDSWDWIDDAVKPRLKAYSEVLSHEDLKITGIKKKIDGLNYSQKEFLGNMLVQIAKADGTVSIDETKLLEKIFKVLNLDTKDLYNQMNATNFDPVTISVPTGNPAEFAITPPKEDTPKVQINMNKVAAIKADSEKVSSILTEIFASDDIDPDIKVTEHTSNLLALSPKLSTLVYSLISKPIWNSTELENLFNKHNLMMEGSIEEINEASFDIFDEALIEENGDNYEINQDIVKELEQNE